MSRPRTLAVAVAAVLAAVLASATAVSAAPQICSQSVVLRDDALTMDETITGPTIDLTIENRGTKVHELAVARVRPGTTVRDAIAAAAAGIAHPPFVLDDPGGVSFLGVGERVRYQRQLTPGTYLFVVPTAGGAPQLVARAYRIVRVVDRGGRASAESASTVSLRDESISLPAVSAGVHRYAITNVGTTPHELFVVGVRDPADLDRADQLGAWLEGGQQGPPPFAVHLPGSHQTIDPGVSVWLTWDLHAATTYAFVDFQTGATAVAATS